MPGFRTSGLLLLLSCGLLVSCAANESSLSGYQNDSPAGGAAGSSGTAAVPTSLVFDGLGDSQNLPILPSEKRTLRVVASPPGTYPIRFGLLGTTGGASLDRSEVESNADGVAEVTLTSPETEELFYVRASVGSAIEAKLQVVVGKSFATLQVRHHYTGKRPIVYWVGSARKGESCDDLPINPPDGDWVDEAIPESDGPPDFPTLTSVPTGSPWVVTLRAARYIQGCAVITSLVPNKVNEIVVPVQDVPLKLSGADLDLALNIDPATANLDALLDKAEAQMFDRLSPGLTSDVDTLLDAMEEATDPVQRSGFVNQRSRGAWDTWLAIRFGLFASTEMQRPLRAWFATARTQVLEREMLSGRLLATQLSADTAVLQINRTFGYDPTTAGFSPAQNTPLSMTAEPDDSLVVGGKLDWHPAQLLGRFVTDAASAAGAGASSVPEALAAQLSCDKVASELLDHGADTTVVFPGCDRGCAAGLCKSALQNLWKRMTDVTDSQPARLVLSATGKADVDDHANVASVSKGAWSANVEFATVTGKLAGGLEATAVPKQPPTQ